VLKAFNPNIQNADVDLDKTYTTEFVEKAGKSAG
jgi:NitT/TauT family transport system substrate-binding protein